DGSRNPRRPGARVALLGLSLGLNSPLRLGNTDRLLGDRRRARRCLALVAVDETAQHRREQLLSDGADLLILLPGAVLRDLQPSLILVVVQLANFGACLLERIDGR